MAAIAQNIAEAPSSRNITRRAPVRELALTVGTSVVFSAFVLGMGYVTGSRPCASAVVCWGLVVAGILGTYLLSRGLPWGWLWLASLQPLWVAYALNTEQYGLVVGSLAYAIGQMNGFVRARRG